MHAMNGIGELRFILSADVARLWLEHYRDVLAGGGCVRDGHPCHTTVRNAELARCAVVHEDPDLAAELREAAEQVLAMGPPRDR